MAEAAASDMPIANALANALAIEKMQEVSPSGRANFIRCMALEIERVAMHISDLGGLAGDIGFLAISSTLSRLRGAALRLAELLAGTRFQRGFVCPGGVTRDPSGNLTELQTAARQLKRELIPVLESFFE